MTRFGGKSLAAAVALLALSCPVDGWAMAPQSGAVAIGTANMVVAQAAAPDAAAGGDQGGLSDATKQGIGCLVGATASLGYATFVAGATETLMMAAGGLLAPSASSTLWLGLGATLAAATCSLGSGATPAVLWAVEQKDNIGANLTRQAQVIGNTVMEAASHAATAVAGLPDAVMSALTGPAVVTAHELAERPDDGR